MGAPNWVTLAATHGPGSAKYNNPGFSIFLISKLSLVFYIIHGDTFIFLQIFIIVFVFNTCLSLLPVHSAVSEYPHLKIELVRGIGPWSQTIELKLSRAQKKRFGRHFSRTDRGEKKRKRKSITVHNPLLLLILRAQDIDDQFT